VRRCPDARGLEPRFIQSHQNTTLICPIVKREVEDHILKRREPSRQSAVSYFDDRRRVIPVRPSIRSVRTTAHAQRVRRGCSFNGPQPPEGTSFGGFKQSGLGREMGTAGLEAYLEQRAIALDPNVEPEALSHWELNDRHQYAMTDRVTSPLSSASSPSLT